MVLKVADLGFVGCCSSVSYLVRFGLFALGLFICLGFFVCGFVFVWFLICFCCFCFCGTCSDVVTFGYWGLCRFDCGGLSLFGWVCTGLFAFVILCFAASFALFDWFLVKDLCFVGSF